MIRIGRLALTALLALSGVPAVAPAQAPSTGPEVLTLSDSEKAAVLRQKASANDPLASLDALAPQPTRQLHGEIGAFIGTNGARGAYGTAAFPLGQNGDAAVSFETERYGARR